MKSEIQVCVVLLYSQASANIFDNIKHVDDANQEYWKARELCATIGYREYKNFKPVNFLS